MQPARWSAISQPPRIDGASIAEFYDGTKCKHRVCGCLGSAWNRTHRVAWWTMPVDHDVSVHRQGDEIIKFLRVLPVPGREMAGGPGFEPRRTESESAILPLNYPPRRANTSYCAALYTPPKALTREFVIQIISLYFSCISSSQVREALI